VAYLLRGAPARRDGDYVADAERGARVVDQECKGLVEVLFGTVSIALLYSCFSDWEFGLDRGKRGKYIPFQCACSISARRLSL
jgi:hypothetical protein